MMAPRSSRYYSALWQWLLPNQEPAPESQGVVRIPAQLPGRSTIEVYGMAGFAVLFHLVWTWDWLGRFWLALPGSLLLLHTSVILGAYLFSTNPSDTKRQAHHGPQRFHWTIMSLMAIWAISSGYSRSVWLAWPWLVFISLNVFAWFHLRRWYRLGIVIALHLVGVFLWIWLGWHWGLPYFFVLHMLMLAAGLTPGCSWYGPVLRSLDRDSKDVWLTIDDGPATEDTRAMLELLDAYEAKVTFFLVGDRAESAPDLVREIANRGHGVANHTATHPQRWFWCLPWWRAEREIADCQQTLTEITGDAPTLFRSPVGHTTPFLHPLLETLGLRLIGWDVRGFDGVANDHEAILTRIQNKVRGGSIILLHQGRPVHLQVLKELLPWLHGQGFRVVVPKEFD